MSASDFLREIVPENIQKLTPYQPGKPLEELERELGISGAIKIASNENPIGPSPRAVEAARQAMAEANFYPDGYCYKLRRALSERLEVAPEEIVFGAGCNEIIYMVIAAFCRPGVDEVLTHEYAFVSYRLASLQHGAHFVEAPVTPEFRCDVDALIERMTPRTRIIFLANPNNPTGAHLTRAELERVLEAAPPETLVVIDEAYHEYATAADPEYPTSQPYRGKGRRLLLTLRTFSKVYGLAGMRIGYGIGDAEVLSYLERVRRPFNANAVAQAAALAALDDTEHLRRSTDAATSGIAALRRAVEGVGLTAYPSLGNFVLVDAGRPAGEVYDALLKKGVIVRPMSAWGLDTHLRISVGSPEQTERVARALSDVLG